MRALVALLVQLAAGEQARRDEARRIPARPALPRGPVALRHDPEHPMDLEDYLW